MKINRVLLFDYFPLLLFYHLPFGMSLSLEGSSDKNHLKETSTKFNLSTEWLLKEGPQNLTALLEEKVELRCRFESSLNSSHLFPSQSSFHVLWENLEKKNLGKNGANYRVHNNGSLIFRSIMKEDEGGYRCGLSSSDYSPVLLSPYAYITVQGKVSIVMNPDVIRGTFGTHKDLMCTAVGDPAPTIMWFKENERISEGSEYKPFTYYSRSVLRINITETANYSCYALNMMKNGQSSDIKSFMVYLNTNEPSKKKNIGKKQCSGYCAPYNSGICQRYLQGRGLVWFNVSQDSSGGWLNEKITEGIWNELIENLHEPCRSAAEALLCKYSFPDCILQDGCAIGLPLCYEDCVALRSHYCYNDWAMLVENKKKGITLLSRGHFRLPHCETLPKHNTSKTCTKTSITDMRYDLATTNCIKGNGRFYQGTINATKEGVFCQPWFSSFPHSQTIPEGVFPEMMTAQSYCRNPGGTEPSPWCYTKEPSLRWQYCSIPTCENMSAPVDYVVETSDEASQRNEEEKYLYMTNMVTPELATLLASVFIVFAIVILLIALLFSQGCSRNKSGYSSPKNQDTTIDLDKLPQNQSYHQHASPLNPQLEKLEYPRNDIIYIRDIGQGAFGRVFQAKAPGLCIGEEFTMVAVKMLKEEASEDLVVDFEREASLLSQFDHPHIVKLLGVCAIGKPMCLLFEYMAKGDLNAYLRSNTPTNYIIRNGSTSSTNISGNDLTFKITHLEQISLAKQICKGMVYLSDRKFVHRDLATRNCLIDHTGTVKIADFGLSQKMAHKDYYRGDESDAIPIRWMPLESIVHNKYTIESDIWAYGVLLWEIFSLALQPYYGLSHEDVIKYLKEGNVLLCPENTPKSIYKIMLSTWNGNPMSRPTFRILFRELETIESELFLIQRHYKSQKSILSHESIGRMTSASPQIFV